MDPKELKIPNICFTSDDGKSGVSEEYKKQRIERGFDDTETFSLFITIANFILPRLKRYKEISKVHPVNMTFEEWNLILDKIIESFELITKPEYFWFGRDNPKIQEGIDLFAKYFRYLWW